MVLSPKLMSLSWHFETPHELALAHAYQRYNHASIHERSSTKTTYT